MDISPKIWQICPHLLALILFKTCITSGEDSNIGDQKHFIFEWTLPFKGEVCYILQYEC